MGAGRQRRLAFSDGKADQLLAVRAFALRGEQRPAADELAGALQPRPADAEVVRHGRAVRVLADDDVALFGAQDHQRFQTDRHRPESLARLLQPPPQPFGGVGADRQFVAAVAGERNAGDANFLAPKRP